MHEYFEYLTQGQIGEIFGVTSHRVGRWLVEIGLRTKDKQPSQRAHHEGFVTFVQTDFSSFFAWHREKTIAELTLHGYGKPAETPKSDDATQTAKTQVFSLRSTNSPCFEVVNPNGVVKLWVVGELEAFELLRLLNLAARCGKIPHLES